MTKHAAENHHVTEKSPIDSSSIKLNDKKQSMKKRTRVDNNKPMVADESAAEQQQWSKSKKKRMRLRSMKERQQTQTISDEISNDTKKTKTQTQTKQNRDATSLQLGKVSSVTPKITSPSGTLATIKSSHKANPVKVGSTSSSSSSSALQKAFQERLTGSRFRHLNEELYTSTSTIAFQRFQQNPSLFDEYHEGFRHQVEQWPINPVTIIVEQLRKLYQTKMKTESSKKKMKKIVVADFGCGEAELARQILLIRDINSNVCPFTVHSFDLVAKGPNAELITACDAAHTPITAGTVDYGIFCLALMGTNLADFIREGHRVLKPDGRLFIVEVRSRFESVTPSSNTETSKKDKSRKETGGNEASLQEFINVLDQLGFETYHTDRTNTMFVLLNLKKNGKKPRKDLKYSAKPCIYKRR